MAAWLLAVEGDVVAIGGVTGMCLAAFVAALRLLSTGTARIDASAEARVEKRHAVERERWDRERQELLERIGRLERRVAGIEDP